MQHIQAYDAFQMYEAFGWGTSGTGRLIIVEGTAPFAPEVQEIVNDMEESGELAMVDMSTCDVAEIQNAVASGAKKILFVNGDDCERTIRYAVMDLHPEIIPADAMQREDLIV
jgi:hypothetical protein